MRIVEGGDDSGRFDPAELNLAGVVEPALAEALMLAARAGQWGVVGQLAAELEARRVRRTVSPDCAPAPITSLVPGPLRSRA